MKNLSTELAKGVDGPSEIRSNGILSTPKYLVKGMIDDCIPERHFISDSDTFIDPACGYGTFLKYIYYKLRLHGHSHENAVSRIYGIDKFSPANETNDLFPNIIKKDFLTDMPKQWPKTFNIVVSNPPYKSNVDIKFLNKSMDIATDRVLFVHPGAYSIQKKDTYRPFVDLRERVEPYLESVTLFNGNGIFDIGLFIPCVITNIDLNKEGGKIKVHNIIEGQEYEVDKVNQIVNVKNSPHFWTIKSKIDALAAANGSIDDRINKKEPKEYLVEFSRVRGGVNTKGGMDARLYEAGQFTFVRKDLRAVPAKKIEFDMWMWFDNEDEGNNAIQYLRTDIARFCLVIYKFAQSINGGEMTKVPNFDFTVNRTEAEYNSLFGLTPEEISYIKEVVPEYYR